MAKPSGSSCLLPPASSLLGALSLVCRPDDALIRAPDSALAFVDELLQALAFEGLGHIDVAVRVGHDAVCTVELTRLAPTVAEARNDLHLLAVDDVDLLVHAVGQIDVLLVRVARECDVPDRPGTQRVFGDEQLFDIRAVLLEHLNAVAHAVAHIDQPVE